MFSIEIKNIRILSRYQIGRLHSEVEHVDLWTLQNLLHLLHGHFERAQLRIVPVSVVVVRCEIKDPFLRERTIEIKSNEKNLE